MRSHGVAYGSQSGGVFKRAGGALAPRHLELEAPVPGTHERESLGRGGFGREVSLDQRVDLHGPRMRLVSLGLSVHR